MDCVTRLLGAFRHLQQTVEETLHRTCEGQVNSSSAHRPGAAFQLPFHL